MTRPRYKSILKRHQRAYIAVRVVAHLDLDRDRMQSLPLPPASRVQRAVFVAQLPKAPQQRLGPALLDQLVCL